jgi:hypothetical protein
VSNGTDGKRWVILPPPSPNSARISGEFTLQPPAQRKEPARRTVSGEILVSAPDDAPAQSFVQELEPFDSERVTEVPTSDEMLAPPELRSEPEGETIPAPAPGGEDLGPVQD